MKRKCYLAFPAVILLSAILLSACGQSKGDGENSNTDIATVYNDYHTEEVMPEPDVTIKLIPEDASTFNGGKFEGFGTSLCWWANRLGYSDILASQAAELFYDKEKGLGMTIARFNIGGGDDPGHNHITRTDSAMPGYTVYNAETGEITFDKNADFNQRNVLLRCKEAAGDEFIAEAFSNSPPYYMTVSGCSSGNTIGSKDNLKADKIDDFTAYMADVIKLYRDEYGITFTSVDPMNEPDTDYWKKDSVKQEGCHFSPGQMQSDTLVSMRKALDERGLTDCIVSGTDETSTSTQISSILKLTDEAKAAIGRIDTHTYSYSQPTELKELVESIGKNFWMSEVDGNGNLGNLAIDEVRAGEMGSGLWLAKTIMRDLNGLKPSAWILWQAIDSHISKDGYNGNKDTGMPNISGGFWGLACADHDNEGIILTDKYYCFGQFSRYIRPGSTIIGSDNNKCVAAIDSKKDELVIVMYNELADDLHVRIDLSMFDYSGSSVKIYRTSGDSVSGEHWACLAPVKTEKDHADVALKGFSVTTYVFDGVKLK